MSDLGRNVAYVRKLSPVWLPDQVNTQKEHLQ